MFTRSGREGRAGREGGWEAGRQDRKGGLIKGEEGGEGTGEGDVGGRGNQHILLLHHHHYFCTHPVADNVCVEKKLLPYRLLPPEHPPLAPRMVETEGARSMQEGSRTKEEGLQVEGGDAEVVERSLKLILAASIPSSILSDLISDKN